MLSALASVPLPPEFGSVAAGLPTEGVAAASGRAGLPVTAPPAVLSDVSIPVWSEIDWLAGLVRRATGPGGLAIIFVYSFLIAFALPGVSEVVLLAPLNLGLPAWIQTSLIILVSGVGKAAGSVFAFHIGQEAKQAGPIVRALERSRFDLIGWSERRAVDIARRWGYAGLAVALSVPFFPDTISIYAFAVLEEDYARFAAATFAGSVGRLLVTLGIASSVLWFI